MEMAINNVKRKKRRTRRCLDEIRKRAHSFSCRNESKDNNINEKSSGINKALNFNKQCITIHRLTLLPKAIKSETVTRPVLLGNKYERQHETIVKTKKIFNQSPAKVLDETETESEHVKDPSLTNTDIDSVRRNEIYKFNDSSPNSFNLFSPIINFDDNNGESSSISNISSLHAQDDCGYQLYEEFINKVPMYLKRIAPNILTEDVMADTKSYLKNLYMEESPQKSIVYLSSDSTVSSSPGTFVQNPKDYLKQQHMFGQVNLSSATDSEAHPHDVPCLRKSPCLPAVNGRTLSIIHITPEYNFYPHKLN